MLKHGYIPCIFYQVFITIEVVMASAGEYHSLFLSGGVGSSDKTVNQVIIGWVVFFLLILAIAVVVYIVINIIFKGYSRTLRDLLQWNMSNKVDIKTEFAGKDGALYNGLLFLAKNAEKEASFLKAFGIDINVSGFCESGLCDNVFLHFFSVLDTYYQPEFTDSKLSQALIDYIAYYDKISADLGLVKMSLNDRIDRVNFIIDGVNNYMEIYSEIISQEMEILCKLNALKEQKQRNEFDVELRGMRANMDKYLKRYGVEAVTTNMEFADFFIDPVYIVKCGTSIPIIYKQQLQNSDHENIRKDVQKVVKDIRSMIESLRKTTTKEEKDRLMEQIKTAEQDKLNKEKQMARIRKAAMEQARRIHQQETLNNNKEITSNNKATPKKKKDNVFQKLEKKIKQSIKKTKKNEKKVVNEVTKVAVTAATPVASALDVNIIKMNGDKSGPLLTTRSDGKFNKVYVPCYKAYLHYVNSNANNEIIKGLLSSKMGKDDIVAFLFLQDLKALQESTTRQTPPFIMRVLMMRSALENVALRLREMFQPKDDKDKEFISIGQALMNILLEAGVNGRLTKLDIQRYKFAKLLEAYRMNNFDDINVRTSYTWYLTELTFMSRENAFDVILSRFNDMTNGLTNATKVDYAQRLNTFMNIANFNMNGLGINNIEMVTNRLKVSKPLREFVLHYPIFSSLFFSHIAQLDKRKLPNTYDNAVNNARRIYNRTSNVITGFMNDVAFRLDDDIDVHYRNLMNRVHSAKQFIIYAHMVHLHFTQYKQMIVENDSLSKTGNNREGFVELYNEQYMDSKEFFTRLITPFKRDFLENRVFNQWKRLFYGPRFSKTSKISYWIEFDAFWIGTLRPKADQMIKSVWADVGKSAKLRW